MKIVIATPILYAPNSPFNHLMKDILQGLLDAGHSITRIVATDDLQDTSYKMGLEDIHYIPVLRKKAEHGNIIKRYLSDTLTNRKMAKLIKKSSADVLFEDVSYSSCWSIWAAKRKKMQIVSMFQDVWPDNAVQSGLIGQDSLVYKFFSFWQKPVYKHSDRFICISDDMKAFVATKGADPEKISVIYNWGYTDDTVNIPWEENAFVKKYDLSPDIFYPIYAGNIGRMQNVELILRAAAQLKDRKDIQFLIIGEGARLDAIHQMAQDLSLSNATFLPFQPSELATAVYSAAGANLIPLVPDGVKTALPSKTGVCLSCGQPIVFCFGNDCNFSQVAQNYHAGLCVSAEDPAELANAIATLANDPHPEKQYGLFLDRFVKANNVKAYVGVITQ